MNIGTFEHGQIGIIYAFFGPFNVLPLFHNVCASDASETRLDIGCYAVMCWLMCCGRVSILPTQSSI